jgi:peroxiredoxin
LKVANPLRPPTENPAPPASAPPAFGELDLLPDIILPDQEGCLRQLATDMSGKKLLLLLCPDPRLKGCVDFLSACAKHFAALDAAAHVYAVTNTPPPVNKTSCDMLGLPFPCLSDLKGQVSRGLAVSHNLSPPPEGRGAFTLFLADANRRILRIDRNLTDTQVIEDLSKSLESRRAAAPRALGHFAPLLYLPQVLDLDFCRELIAAFEAGDPEAGRAYRHDNLSGEGEYVVDPTYKIRRDFYITERGLAERLRWAMVRRIKPEIQKAFTRDISGIEEFKVVCYDGSEGGHFRPHRDNMSRHNAHRRFAMTLNLNDGYEGGALRFPEYGPDHYQPAAGDAVVFSCSLMHEALPVTKGERYVLLSFLFDEESKRLSSREIRQV